MYEQYNSWNALKGEFGEEGFDVLAVPTNNFGLQEPGENADLLNGIRWVRPGGDFVPDFRVAGKTEANGANENPVYTYMKGLCPNPQNMITDTEQIYWSPVKQSDITWNFEKILIDHEGKPYRRYVPAMNPENSVIRDDIEFLLSRKKEADAAKKVEEKKEHNKIKKPSNLKELLKKRAHH